MLGEYFGHVAQEIGRALLLRPNLDVHFGRIEVVTITLAVLVAVSVLAGRSAMLAINRVRGLSYLFLVVTTGLRVVAMVGGLTVTLWLLTLVVNREASLITSLHGIILASSPEIFAFIAIAPGIGPFLSRALAAWSFLILWDVTAQLAQTDRWTALLISAIAGLIALAGFHGLARPAAHVRNMLWRRMTGRELRRSSTELLEIEGLLEKNS